MGRKSKKKSRRRYSGRRYAVARKALKELLPSYDEFPADGLVSPNVVINGMHYVIDWQRLHSGCSFFLKTTATPAQVMYVLRRAAGPLAPYLKAQARHEFGYYGVRVWRLG